MMTKKFIPVVLFVLGVVIFSFAACGGGGDSDKVEICLQEYDEWSKDHEPLPDSDNLEDTYTLEGFLVNFYEDGDFIGYLDENDFSSWAGTMTIGAGSISQTITVEGDTSSISATYTNSPIDTWTGILHVNQSGNLYDVGYMISGNILTTDSGLQCSSVSPSASAEALGTEECGIGALFGTMADY